MYTITAIETETGNRFDVDAIPFSSYYVASKTVKVLQDTKQYTQGMFSDIRIEKH